MSMAFDPATYKRITGRLDLDGIDFDAFRDEPLAPEHLRCLRYMHDVERHTTCYLRNLLNTKAHHDPEITSFLTMWGFEEYWHGEALGRVLEAHDEPGGDAARGGHAPAAGVEDHRQPGAVDGVLGRHQALPGRAHDLWRHQRVDHPGRLFPPHRYRTQAHERLEASAGAQRTTRFMVRKLWEPVGAQVMPLSETEHLVGTLFGDADGRVVSDRVDRRIDALPGVGGLGLMQGALTKYGRTPALSAD